MQTEAGESGGERRRALVVCTHLRPSRDKRRTSYYMQPLNGLHVASLIPAEQFDVHLHHEDWHGPFEPSGCAGWDLVFLTGLQPDFDRMRQLSYYFRRHGSIVVAGGSVCSSFPEFASEFFDAVCAGGTDAVRTIVSDYLSGSLKPIYRSRATQISPFRVDYGVFAKAGISPAFHLMEASRGCSFKCSFCSIPAEIGDHAVYGLESVAAALESALESSPRFSLRRLYPLVLFLDNNFGDDRDYMLRVARYLAAHRKVRGWAALVTQNILQDRPLVQALAGLKCIGLFVGIESLDAAMLRRYRKTQNLSRRSNVLDDIAHAERLGVAITYGYLFDPRHQTADDMRRQMTTIGRDLRVPMPVYVSLIAPLAGTEAFWNDLRDRRLAPNLLMRELDGETICYANLADDPAAVSAFAEVLFRRPWRLVGPWRLALKTVRRVLTSGTASPVRWLAMTAANLHCFAWSRRTPLNARTFLPGRDALDPQYRERPADLSAADAERYFAPIKLTDEAGAPASWLEPYLRAREVGARA